MTIPFYGPFYSLHQWDGNQGIRVLTTIGERKSDSYTSSLYSVLVPYSSSVALLLEVDSQTHSINVQVLLVQSIFGEEKTTCQVCAYPQLDIYPLVMTNIAIENGPFIVDFPIKNGDFP